MAESPVMMLLSVLVEKLQGYAKRVETATTESDRAAIAAEMREWAADIEMMNKQIGKPPMN